MFYKLPIELEYKILFMAHPILKQEIKDEINNYKFLKKKSSIMFHHPIKSLLFLFK